MTKTEITKETRVSLALVILLLVFTVSILAAWSEIKMSLSDMNHKFDDATKSRWTERDDYDFERRQSELNNLKMPEHKRTTK